MRDLENIAEGRDINDVMASIPYVAFLGITFEPVANELLAKLTFKPDLIGNPVLPALHGGVIGGFLETAAIVQVARESKIRVLPKTIDITIDYLRSGRPLDVYARATITKHGRRVANVQVIAWQDDPAKPIAAAHGHFLLEPLNGDDAIA
ncbi:PaaI family thioesterase [Pyruvatibacter sp.]|uniref:PaaI family thioesterase n=1 Tax=Pyruvatibacter sp. TaxID=1981328 RepID=UPI0032F03FFD